MLSGPPVGVPPRTLPSFRDLFHVHFELTGASSRTHRNNNATLFPPKCPQSNIDASEYSEDCLYAIAYAPKAALNTPNALPVYVW